VRLVARGNHLRWTAAENSPAAMTTFRPEDQ
jgi:hypothetical protein